MVKYIDMEEFRNNLEVDRFGMTDVRKVNEALERFFVSLREQEQSKWISVKERLPEDGGMVLAVVNGKPHPNITLRGAFELAEYSEDDEGGWILEMWPEWTKANVTHWMPLPEPPKEE